MRLTAELISYGQVFMNPLRERQLSLRGYKIPSIENLGATQDQFDTFDFSDNDILKLDNFPLFKRLTSLLLSNNKISVIADGLGAFLPKLESLVLSNNKLSQFSELNPLADLLALRRLTLIGNAVTRQRDYRLYVIALLPKLKVLDFNKVTAKERLDALQKFGVIKRASSPSSDDQKSAAASASASSSSSSKTFVPGGDLPASLSSSSSSSSSVSQEIRNLTPELREAITVGIRNAQTMEEIDALEKALSTGKIPRSLAVRLNLPLPEDDQQQQSSTSSSAAAAAPSSSSSSSAAGSTPYAVDANMDESS